MKNRVKDKAKNLKGSKFSMLPRLIKSYIISIKTSVP